MSQQLSDDARLAVLEKEMSDLKEQYESDMRAIRSDLQTLVIGFSRMTGGQKAWFTLAATLGAIIGAIASLSILFRGFKH